MNLYLHTKNQVYNAFINSNAKCFILSLEKCMLKNRLHIWICFVESLNSSQGEECVLVDVGGLGKCICMQGQGELSGDGTAAPLPAAAQAHTAQPCDTDSWDFMHYKSTMTHSVQTQLSTGVRIA